MFLVGSLGTGCRPRAPIGEFETMYYIILTRPNAPKIGLAFETTQDQSAVLTAYANSDNPKGIKAEPATRFQMQSEFGYSFRVYAGVVIRSNSELGCAILKAEEATNSLLDAEYELDEVTDDEHCTPETRAAAVVARQAAFDEYHSQIVALNDCLDAEVPVPSLTS